MQTQPQEPPVTAPAGDALPSPERKATEVRRMFDRIAGGYDRMNILMTGGLDRGWRRDVIRSAAIRPGDVALDIACGTGDLTLLAEGAGAKAYGIDFSREMLRVAGQRAPASRWLRGDALRLPLPDASVDVITCGFALRNFVAIPPFLEESARVMRPGGRLVLLEVATPRNALIRFGHQVYFNRVVPLLGRAFADAQAYSYLPQSVVYLPEPPELAAMVRDAGFGQVETRMLGMGAVQRVRGIRS